MTEYVNAAVPINRGEVRQRMVDEFTDLSGATVAPGTAWDMLFDVFAGFGGDLGEQTTQVHKIIFRTYGELIMRIMASSAAPATGTVTITAVDDDGPYFIPAGSELSVAGLDGGRVAFYTTADATVENGDTTVASVPVVAGVTGEQGNGLTTDARFETSLADIESVAFDGVTAGGTDSETEEEYLDRLADQSPLQAITLVLPDDFARYSRNYLNVGAALALDLYNADTDTEDEPGAITVAVRDDTGDDPGSPTRTALLADLTDLAISDLDVFVIPPTETNLAVVRAVVPYPGFTQADADASADAAITALYDRSTWGILPFGDQRKWVETTVARYQDLVTAVNNAEGVSHYTTLTLNGGTADVTLAGPAAIPDLTGIS